MMNSHEVVEKILSSKSRNLNETLVVNFGAIRYTNVAVETWDRIDDVINDIVNEVLNELEEAI